MNGAETLWGLVWMQMLQVTLVALVAGGLVWSLCRRRPHLGYVLLLVVVVKCVTPPLWTSSTGVFSWAYASRGTLASESALGEVSFEPEAALSAIEPVPVTGQSETDRVFAAVAEPRERVVESASVVHAEPVPAESSGGWFRFDTALLFVWGSGAFLLAGIIAGRGYFSRRMLRQSSVAVSDSVRGLVEELAARLGIRRRVRVLVTTSSFGPAVCGAVRPTVVLPEAVVSSSSAEDLERIVAHELVHIRRGDDLMSMLQIFAQVVWWFHPLVWWTNRQICRVRERCCDEETIAGLSCQPGDYAQTLLDILRQKRQPAPLLAFASRASEVTTQRLEGILQRRPFRRRMPWRCWAVLIVGLVVVLPGAGLKGDVGAALPGPEPDVTVAAEADEEPELDAGISSTIEAVPIAKEKPVEYAEVVAVWPPQDGKEIDPVTEIRIRFDRPVDPEIAGISWTSGRGTVGFRSRGKWTYLKEKNEFALPVVLTPGSHHEIELQSMHAFQEPISEFRSKDGIPVRKFAWSFWTRELAEPSDGAAPAVVSIDPKSGSETGLVTFLRLEFDQAVDAEYVQVRGVNVVPKRGFPSDQLVSTSLPRRYDADTRTLTVPLLFKRAQKPLEVEVSGIRSLKGVPMEPLRLTYTPSDQQLAGQDEERINEAGRDQKLRELLERIREARSKLNSAEITVRSSHESMSGGWCSRSRMVQSEFAFQGERQFYADISNIMHLSRFVIASNEEECWFQNRDKLKVVPWGEMDEKNVVMADPFPEAWYETAEEAIRKLKLEYCGTAKWSGKTCHRICSWQGRTIPMGDDYHVWGLVQWLIDAESLRPLAVEIYGTSGGQVHEYRYRHVNETIAESLFAVPGGEGITRVEAEPLGEGYDSTYLNARDGSSGRMSVRWGKKGAAGTSSSGLN